MTISSRLQAYVCALALALPLMLAPLAEATTIECGVGDVHCLLAAISQANADPQHKTTIRLAGGTYALTTIDNDTNGPNGLPSIVSSVTIDGGKNGATLTRLPGALGFRILHVGASGRLTLQGVTITNNAFDFASFNDLGSGLFNDGGDVTVVESSFIGNVLGDVGALYNNHGVVSIIDSTFRGNFGFAGAGVTSAGGVVDITRTVFENNDGLTAGGVWSMDADVRIVDSRFTGGVGFFGAGGLLVSGGTASISQTTFESNQSHSTGGIRVDEGVLEVRDSAFVGNGGEIGVGITNFDGTVEVINTTFARNLMGFAGTLVGIAVANAGRMTLINSTFAENRFLFQGPPPPSASVIANFGNGTTLLQNTIVVHSSDDGSVEDCGGVITSLGNNLIGDPSSCIITLQPSDLTGDAGLGQLVDDGTPGNAHYALLPDSPAVDAANDAACSKKDQIGRPRQPHCDIGAVEFRRSDVTAATE
jgi:hypothetical protein